jgi:hypothetical protein
MSAGSDGRRRKGLRQGRLKANISPEGLINGRSQSVFTNANLDYLINGVAQEIRAGRRKACSLQQLGILRSVSGEDLISKGLRNGQRDAMGQVERMNNNPIGLGLEVITG